MPDVNGVPARMHKSSLLWRLGPTPKRRVSGLWPMAVRGKGA
jgi:hypothetical protein